MNIPTRRRTIPFLAAGLALAGVIAAPAPKAWAAGPMVLAQDQPPDNIQGQDQGDAESGDPSALLLRVGRLEEHIRRLTGQIEELQYQNKRLEDNLRKMQQDVDFRFQDLQGHGAAGAPARPAPLQKRGDAAPESTDPLVAARAGAAPIDTPSTGSTPLRARRAADDAFDPAADPTAPGAPQPLGTTRPSPALPRAETAEANAPLDLMRRQAARADRGGDSAAAPADTPTVIAAPSAARALPNPNAVASLVPGGTREEFDADIGLYKQGQFDSAATGLQSFVEKYPKDRLVPDAVYVLGESYSRLGRHREAAEQFLKLSTDYSKSARAPDALLRLGMSLNALGAKEQACATYQEVNRKYPAASAEVRASVDRELKRARCRTDG